MLKTPDQKPTPCEPACYEEVSEPALGISFEKRGGSRRYALAAFLSAVDYNGQDEMIFHFAIGLIVVRGKNLDGLWRAVRKGELVRVWESEEPKDSEATWVRELEFRDLEAE